MIAFLFTQIFYTFTTLLQHAFYQATSSFSFIFQGKIAFRPSPFRACILGTAWLVWLAPKVRPLGPVFSMATQ